MTAKLLVAATDTFRNYGKGGIVSILPEGADYGIKETLPNYVRLIISDATREEAHNYIDKWVIDFVHTLSSQNAQRWRYSIEVDPAYISATGVGTNEMKTRMRDYVNDKGRPWEGVTVVSLSVSAMLINIPKNGPYQTANALSDNAYLKVLRDEFSDIFKTVLRIDRYYFAEADVDAAVVAGGEVTITKAQALSKVIDRLTE